MRGNVHVQMHGDIKVVIITRATRNATCIQTDTVSGDGQVEDSDNLAPEDAAGGDVEIGGSTGTDDKTVPSKCQKYSLDQETCFG